MVQLIITKFCCISVLLIFTSCNVKKAKHSGSQLVNIPFPQNLAYKNCIIPNHVSREQLNKDVINFYNKWKDKYLRQTNMPGGYYIEGNAVNNKVPSKGTSESQGFGMIATVLMAGYDSLAKDYFDGFFRFFDTHRSITNSALMGWTIAVDERDSSFNSATDGDLDIAYALLLADKQWGSNGKINYLQEAKNIISQGLKKSCVDHKTMRIVLGDWDSEGSASRSSDWMTAHLRAFEKITGDSFWLICIDSVYSIMEQITKYYSPNTGLMPDFVSGTPVKPVKDGFLERDSDNDFSWNACRFPWRITMDYIHYNVPEAKEVASRVASWVIESSKNDPSNITAVYTLEGIPLLPWRKSSAFTSPLLVACMTDTANQEYINKGWEVIKDYHLRYFSDSINLLCMLVLSGNWWAPV